jgi:hypothetical protein
MTQLQLWQARAAHARRSAKETRNEGQKSLLLLYAEECERKAERCKSAADTTPAHPHRAARLSLA